jgi:hypothetical protein
MKTTKEQIRTVTTIMSGKSRKVSKWTLMGVESVEFTNRYKCLYMTIHYHRSKTFTPPASIQIGTRGKITIIK